MPRSLFEFLGVAGVERIHTQTIAWLLNAIDSPLTIAERKTLLASLTCECTEEEVSRLVVYTELKSLDLVACTNTEIVLVVENKLKSRQSDEQLPTYVKTLTQVAGLLQLGCERTTKVFLTLSRERSDPGSGWTDVDYRDLSDALFKMPDHPFVTDYSNLLLSLLKARDQFISHHLSFSEVFKRIAWSTIKRLQQPLSQNPSETLTFVDRNRLERIFVETLYRDICATVSRSIVDAGRAGIPLIQITQWKVKFDGNLYRAGLQLQGGTLKLNLASLDYASSALNPALVEFDNYMAPFQLRPNAARARNYRSWSCKAPEDLNVHSASMQQMTAALIREAEHSARRWQSVLNGIRAAGIRLEYEPWPEDVSAGPIPTADDADPDV